MNSTWMNSGSSLVMSYRSCNMKTYLCHQCCRTQICLLSGSLGLTIVLISDANADGDAVDDAPSEVPMEVGEVLLSEYLYLFLRYVLLMSGRMSR